MNINWKFIVKVTGFILILESLFLILSATMAYYHHGTDTQAFVYSAVISFVLGAGLILPAGFRKKTNIINKRDSYVGVAFSWIAFALIGALPFYLSGTFSSFTDAFFESMSGITTTGASIIPNVDIMPRGILFWRSLMQ